MFFNKTIKNITRLSQVINILLKYSFEDIIVTTPLKNFIPPQRKANLQHQNISIFEFNRWERIRMVIEELGATYIKLAQLLSNRPDILPEPLIREFSKLQSNVQPFDTSKAIDIIEAETGEKIDELFVYFDKKPLGSASIGQVHRARLKRGNDVVVKVQRPDAKDKIIADLRFLREFVRITEPYFIEIGLLNPMEVVDAFETSILRELDYRIEAKNIELFKKLYGDKPNLYVPKVFREYSSSKVLFMEHISACEITDVEQLAKWGIQPAAIIEAGIEIYLDQIFDKGFFHADPHPGNVLVKPNGQIALIDFGMVGKLTRREKTNFSRLLLSMAKRDPKGMAISLRNLAAKNEINDLAEFEHNLEELIDDFVIFDAQSMGMRDFSGRLQSIIYKYKLETPGSIFLIIRALVLLEGIGNNLHPSFNTIEYIKPYGLKLIRAQYSAEQINAELQYTFSNLLSFLYSSPIDLKFILKKIRSGTLHSHIELHGLEKFVKRIDIVSHRFSLSLIIAALIITSGIVSSASTPDTETYFGLPIFSAVALAVAGFLGVVLILFNWRNRKF